MDSGAGVVRWPGIALAGALSAAIATGLARKALFVARIDGDSMLPTFGPGDAVLVIRRRVSPMIRRGDVVVCRLPTEIAGPSGYLVKRVTALAGDTVQCEGSARARPGEVLAAGRVFLRGDADRSYDSRAFGPLALANVDGRVIARLSGSSRQRRNRQCSI